MQYSISSGPYKNPESSPATVNEGVGTRKFRHFFFFFFFFPLPYEALKQKYLAFWISQFWTPCSSYQEFKHMGSEVGLKTLSCKGLVHGF